MSLPSINASFNDGTSVKVYDVERTIIDIRVDVSEAGVIATPQILANANTKILK